MGYMHIDNLYKNQKILMHAECYALEKVHGTSANVRWKDGKLTVFSGGEKHENFVALFDQDKLTQNFLVRTPPSSDIVVYGEAYGGKQQRMAATYGDQLRFIVFDIKIDGRWLDVPEMDRVAKTLGFEVVPWERTLTDIMVLDRIRERPSEVAFRRGCGADKAREGIVLRPLHEEVRGSNRLIAKHKNAAFSETKTPRTVSPDDQRVFTEAQAIADEWVIEMRLDHVLDKLPSGLGIEGIRSVLDAMVADVFREAKGEIVESEAARRAICRKTSQMFQRRLASTRADS